ncbi:hypothetical protein CAJAP_10504 [Camponotus japonicus]
MSAKTSKTLDSPLTNVASGIEERRCNLIDRHRNLQGKITTMERSIPALMAYNLWMTESRDHPRDTSYEKVREIVNKLSPEPDPADRLLAELRSTVDDLHRETAQLHDKIIDADVKLEETGMELESLELANKEIEERLIELRNEITRHSTPSLHSIHSDDLICLRKIRQLAEEELKLKNCIKELENKEIMYRRQMNKLLSCKKFQRGKMTGTGKNSKLCPLKSRKHEAYMTKRKYVLKDKGRKACCLCATSMTLIGYEETLKESSKERKKLCPPPSCCIPLDNRAIKSHGCKVCCKSCQRKNSTTIFRSKSPYESTNPSCESLHSVVSKIDVTQSFKRIIQSPVSCNLGKTCNECKTFAACQQINICKCQEKSIRESVAPCDCSDTLLNKTHQSITSGTLSLRSGDSDSDDEFCECCTCGCEAENLSI